MWCYLTVLCPFFSLTCTKCLPVYNLCSPLRVLVVVTSLCSEHTGKFLTLTPAPAFSPSPPHTAYPDRFAPLPRPSLSSYDSHFALCSAPPAPQYSPSCFLNLTLQVSMQRILLKAAFPDLWCSTVIVPLANPQRTLLYLTKWTFVMYLYVH